MPYKFNDEQIKDVIHGLEEIKAVATVKTKVDGSGKGALYYLGYNIVELAEKSNYEEVVFLLLYDKLPSKKELDNFKEKLKQHTDINENVMGIMKKLNPDDDGVASLRTVVSSLSSFDPESEKADEERAIRLIVQLPVLVAYLQRIREGKDLIRPKPRLSIAENFIYMTAGKEDPVKSKVLDMCLLLLADHGICASTLAARQTASTESDMYSCITSAIGALKGRLHGGANQGAIKMFIEIKGSPEKYILDKLSKKEKIMGIGHRVYKDGDPRARILRRYAKELCEKTNNTKLFEKAVEIETVVYRENGLKANVDFFSSLVYYCLGIPIGLFTAIFAMSRIPGWTAHILEQYANNRLMRPRSVYVEELAPLDRKYIEIEKR